MKALNNITLPHFGQKGPRRWGLLFQPLKRGNEHEENQYFIKSNVFNCNNSVT